MVDSVLAARELFLVHNITKTITVGFSFIDILYAAHSHALVDNSVLRDDDRDIATTLLDKSTSAVSPATGSEDENDHLRIETISKLHSSIVDLLASTKVPSCLRTGEVPPEVNAEIPALAQFPHHAHAAFTTFASTVTPTSTATATLATPSSVMTLSCLGANEMRLERLVGSCGTLVRILAVKIGRVRRVLGDCDCVDSAERVVQALVGEWTDGDVGDLEKRIAAVREVLEGIIVPWILKTIDFDEFVESSYFASLQSELQDFITQLTPHRSSLAQPAIVSQARAIPVRLRNTKTVTSEGPEALNAQADDEEERRRAVEDAFTDKGALLKDFILEHLAFTSMKDREDEVAEAHKKTFEWIFKGYSSEAQSEDASRNDFARWLQSNDLGNIYWISGKPGSGKSTLLRFLNDHEETTHLLQQWSGTKPLTTAGFFFWTSGSLEQRSQAGLLRSLLFQLLSENQELIPYAFPELWERLLTTGTKERIKTGISWSLPVLQRGLELFVEEARMTKKICFIIDGLDEFDGDHAEIIAFFKHLVDGDENVKACISSRPWLVFEENFSSSPNMRLQDLTHADMAKYVDDVLAKHPKVRRIARKASTEIGQSLFNNVVVRADGVFLWITLAVRYILEQVRQGDELQDLIKYLDQLPTDLDDLFEYFLFSTQPFADLQTGSKIFQLIRAREVVCEFSRNEGSASLTLWELALADDYDQDVTVQTQIHRAAEEEILHLCTIAQDKLKRQCAGLLILHKRDMSSRSEGLRFVGEDDLDSTRQLATSRINYLHRTVRDYIVHTHGTWDRFLTATVGTGFEAHFSHVRSYVLQLQNPLEAFTPHRRLDEWWPNIVQALTHARYAFQSGTIPLETQNNLLTALDKTQSQHWKSKSSTLAPRYGRLRGLGPAPPNFHSTSTASASTPALAAEEDTWSRAAFGTYESRKSYTLDRPFLSLCAKFGLTAYLESELRAKPTVTTTPAGTEIDTIPLLAHSLQFLFSRRNTVYPLTSPEIIQTQLNCGEHPNRAYTDIFASPKRQRTPWLFAIDLVREAMRRDWIPAYDIGVEKDVGGGERREGERAGVADCLEEFEDHVVRWTDVLKVLVQAGADREGVIVENSFDPRAEVKEVVEEAWKRFGRVDIKEVLRMLE